MPPLYSVFGKVGLPAQESPWQRNAGVVVGSRIQCVWKQEGEGSVERALAAPATVDVRTRDHMYRGRPRATIYGGYTMIVQIINSERTSEV